MSAGTFSAARPAVVLLVDRDPASAASVRRALSERPDVTLKVCGEPDRATEEAATVRAMVVLLAAEASDKETLGLLARLVGIPGAAPVVLLARRASAAFRRQAFAAGAVDLATDLPDPDELAARLCAQARAVLAERERDEARRQVTTLKRRLEERDLDLIGGVASRGRLDEFLDGEWRRARRNGSHLSLVLVEATSTSTESPVPPDPGATSADARLSGLAAVLKGALRRGGDLLGSCGDGRYAAVLPEVGAAGAATVARALRQAVSTAAPTVNLRIGVASLRPQEATTAGPQTLLTQAQTALS